MVKKALKGNLGFLFLNFLEVFCRIQGELISKHSRRGDIDEQCLPSTYEFEETVYDSTHLFFFAFPSMRVNVWLEGVR